MKERTGLITKMSTAVKELTSFKAHDMVVMGFFI